MIVVYSYYVMDILHRGHILHMRNAKKIAGPDGISVVGILTDAATMEKKKAPLLSFDERMIIAQAIRYNDVVIPQDTYSPLTNIQSIKPTFHLESASHSEKDIILYRQVMAAWGGSVMIMPYYPGISSTKIKNDIGGKLHE